MRGTPLNWFSSYLTDRKQYVSVNGHPSDHLKILLLLIYVNDLPNVSKFLTFFFLLMIQISTSSHMSSFIYRKL